MTDEQKAQKIAKLAWEIQPSFRTKFKTEAELAERIIAGAKTGGSSFGMFLPVCILEVMASVEAYKDTLAHAELDALDGENNVSPLEVEKAKMALEHMAPIIPEFEAHCDWATD